ncbi:hypothetical protein K505DRAFT_23690 [Melanomma pulvis-pyrius CBS 109.77]|uniref:Uncharacterized protein n=1 Tax=Melanomma pulvis-pyrius CBS 109.77 TaxID=1314802 RepID=A0A6A6XEX1_9PLEO|nr:hypothetical protein K505DRAFT_23690 [Melanomma pulvis-pyrius CBS 109.77]
MIHTGPAVAVVSPRRSTSRRWLSSQPLCRRVPESPQSMSQHPQISCHFTCPCPCPCPCPSPRLLALIPARRHHFSAILHVCCAPPRPLIRCAIVSPDARLPRRCMRHRVPLPPSDAGEPLPSWNSNSTRLDPSLSPLYSWQTSPFPSIAFIGFSSVFPFAPSHVAPDCTISPHPISIPFRRYLCLNVQ